MNSSSTHPARGGGYELRFSGLFDEGHGYAFPCDANGHVDLDRLSDRRRDNYFYVRAAARRELSPPLVAPVTRTACAPSPS
jgi:hypothetical protein